MNIMYHFHHLDSSDALIADVETRAAALEPLIVASSPIHVRFSVGNNRHTVHIGLQARSGNPVDVEESSEDMYKSIDMAFVTLTRIVKREKEKQVNHHVKADPFLENALAAAAVNNQIDEEIAVDASEVLREYQANGH